MEFSKNLTIEDVKLKYSLDDGVALRLEMIKSILNMNYDELILFLKNIMNYDEMQIWLMRKQMEGIELTLNDELKKFFTLKTNNDILRLYDVEQNYDQNNINELKLLLKS